MTEQLKAMEERIRGFFSHHVLKHSLITIGAIVAVVIIFKFIL